MHAFQGCTVDNAIAVMEANHLTTQKSFYVEISRARDRAELVTDDAGRLRDQLEVVTGEWVSALEGSGEASRDVPTRGMEVNEKAGWTANRGSDPSPGTERDDGEPTRKDRNPAAPTREKVVERDFGL